MQNEKYIVLGLLITLALNLGARTFDAGERLYIDMEAKSVKEAGGDLANGWYSTMNNYNYAYFYKGTNGAWSSQVTQYQGSVWYVEAPAGDWEYVVLTRHNSANPDWSTKITQTGDIWFYYMDGSTKKMREQNYIKNFYYDDGYSKNGAEWEFVAPAPSGNPATWSLTAEDEQLCTDAAGTEYVLQARNYDYDNTYSHAWFIYSGGSWTRLQGDEWRKNEGEKVYTVTLGGVGSDVYYFLQCSRPTMCRLIHVRINQDCAAGAPGACKITSFAAVASDANVTDETCAIDGVVAFDDPVNAGDLKIWADDVDTVIIANAELKTPQTFKLKGFDASSSKTYTLYAKFLNGTTECEASCSVTTKKPTAPVTTHTPSETINGEALTRFTLEDITLTPTNQTSTYFQWTNSANEEVITTGDRNHTFTAPADQMDVEYVFLATNDPPAPEGNLISNGTFEDPALDGYLESNYNAWGRGNTNYYASHAGASGGYAITDDATTFWHEFQKVKAHEGTCFGLFDSKISDGSDQAAWIARSSTKNPNLKVDAGVSYLFSFWVANINAYYQMNNGAQLQFQISYDGGTSWDNLGSLINLGNFKDSRWHGMSSLVTPTVSSTNVVLRVINTNKSSINYGNDFALDDIRFEAVTSRTANIAGFERFQVRYLECQITSASFVQRQPIGCGTDVADVDYTIHFVNPRGDLYIYEGTTELAKILHADLTSATFHTGVLKDQPVDNKPHTLTVYFKDSKVQSPNPGVEFTYDAKAVPAIKVKSLDWTPLPDCDVPTATLTAVISYTNQNGTLTADVDGKPANPATYTVESNAEKDTTLIIPGVPADGKAGHKLTVKFDGSHGCSLDSTITVPAPYMPQVISTAVAVQPYTCGDTGYKVQVTVHYTNSQDSDLVITDEAGHSKTLKYTDTGYTSPATWTFDMPWEDPVASHTFKAYFIGAETCKDNASHAGTYTSPAEPKVENVVQTIPTTVAANTTTFDVSVTFDYTNQDGTLDVNVDDTIKATVSPAFVLNSQTSQSATATITGLPADGTTGRKLNIVFSGGTHNCDAVQILFDAPLTPPAPKAYSVFRDTICEGDNYTANGFTILAPPVGEAVHVNAANDTLYLVVNDGHSMFSKWTDVLFIDNADKRFVAYQWFENGTAISGETEQRLYNPAGLTGSYYCRMTTADGGTIYTCEQTFDKVTPSRSVNSDKPAAAPAVYDTMGRPVQGNLSNGIYIMIEERDGERFVKKVMIHE